MNAALRLLVTSTVGPPDDLRTWSGTPARLLQALAADGRLECVPWFNRSGKNWCRRVDLALGLQHGFMRGPARRTLAAHASLRTARRQRCAAVLHLGTFDAPFWTARLPQYLYVDNTYDLWESQSLVARTLRPRQRRWFRRLERAAVARMRHVFAVGEHVARNFMAAFGLPPERLTVAGAGIGGIRPYAGPKDYGNRQLLTVAKVRPGDKGLFLLLEAFKLARQSCRDLTLTVVGGAAHVADPPQGVRCTGWIAAAELQRLFEEASLFVLPATYEPWGLSYVEALACGTPIAGLARNAFPEISGEGEYGFALEQPTAEALAGLLLRALADPGLLERKGRAGREYVGGRYRWEHAADRIAGTIARTAL